MKTYSIILQKRRSTRLSFDIAILCIAIFWLVKGEFGVSFLLLLVAAFGFYTNRTHIVVFTEKSIIYPSFIPKTYLWDEVSNVILKDDVLTIDLKTNKLLQSTLHPAVSLLINETEFNQFCSELLSGDTFPVTADSAL